MIKDNCPQSAAKRRITSILRTLSTALPLISHSIKSRSSKCAPTNSNALYARQRLHTVSDTPPASGVIKLQQLIDDSSTRPKPTTPKRASTRKRKINVVSPSEKNDVPKDAPTPPNGNKFPVKEALQAFNDYNYKKEKEKLVKYWQSKRWVPERSINTGGTEMLK